MSGSTPAEAALAAAESDVNALPARPLPTGADRPVVEGVPNHGCPMAYSTFRARHHRPYALGAPAVLILSVAVVFPIAFNLHVSVHDWNQQALLLIRHPRPRQIAVPNRGKSLTKGHKD